MREITYQKKRNRIGKLIGVLAVMLVLAALVVFGLFRVREVVVTGNSIYTSADIQEAVMQDGLCKNTLYLMWKYKDDSKVAENLPFLSSVEVTMKKPYQVEIRVYEKPEVGYFLNGTDYVYFDRDGLIVEISKKLRENIPKITGITISKPVRYEMLPVKGQKTAAAETEAQEKETDTEEESGDGTAVTEEDAANQEVFEAVVGITQSLSKNGLVPKEIKFDEQGEITLYFDSMRVKLGGYTDIEEKIAALKSVYEKVEGMEGVLHMEDFSSDSQTINFRQGETEEMLEVEQTEAPGDADASGAGETEDGTESEAGTDSGEQSGVPTYSESDGTFSTDAEGNTIYTDANGNTTPNVDGYQYTDENGGIITDGYGYIDPYTGAYILK